MFVVGRWVFCAPGYLCPGILDVEQGLSHSVAAVRSLNVQNGFWCICVGHADLLELYNVVVSMWVSFSTGTLYGIECLDVRDEEVTGEWRELDKVLSA